MAKVLEKFESVDLAEALWASARSRDGSSRPWALMFSIGQPQAVDISYETLNRTLSWRPANRVQRFMLLSEEKSGAVSRLLPTSATSDRVENWISIQPDVPGDWDELDITTTASRRREQAAVRAYLLGQRGGVCDLCRRTFDADFLVAAHIKPRAACSDVERRQIAEVVMLNCRFGCDELYERGYVAVDDTGTIVVSEALTGSALEYATTRLAGYACARWHMANGSRGFFAFHFANCYLGQREMSETSH